MIDNTYMVPNEDFSRFYPDINVEETTPELTDTLKVSAYFIIQKLFNMGENYIDESNH